MKTCLHVISDSRSGVLCYLLWPRTADLRRLYICDSRQEHQPGVQSPSSLWTKHLIFFEGTVQFPRRNCLTQVGGETYHRPRMLYSNVTVNLMLWHIVWLSPQCRLQLHLPGDWLSVRGGGVHRRSLSRPRLHICLHSCQWRHSEVVSARSSGTGCQYRHEVCREFTSDSITTRLS